MKEWEWDEHQLKNHERNERKCQQQELKAQERKERKWK